MITQERGESKCFFREGSASGGDPYGGTGSGWDTVQQQKRADSAYLCRPGGSCAERRRGGAGTGRPRIRLPQALLAIPGIRYAVVSNGAAVCDLCTGERLYTDCMPLDAAVDILRRTRTLEVVQGAFIGDWGYMEEIGRQRIRALDLVAAMQGYLISSRKIVLDLPAYVAQRGEAPEKSSDQFSENAGRQSPVSGGNGGSRAAISGSVFCFRRRGQY